MSYRILNSETVFFFFTEETKEALTPPCDFPLRKHDKRTVSRELILQDFDEIKEK